MRKITNSTYISLDGVIEAPHEWPSLGVSDERSGEIQTELLRSCDTLLMGRHTYDGFAPVWPTRSGDPYSDRINAMQKYVVSSTLKDPEWNNTAVIDGRGDVVAELERIRSEPGEGIVQYGFGRLSHTLLDHGMLDELRLWVHPFLVRRGRPEDLIFREGALTRFALVDTVPLKSGIVVLTYRFEGATA